ncbi:hypothetical protein M378DRAFT_165397 [Amanita muscaria Koide BX008]|uniref:5-formyltetrahydrofolate cyclo-ligase n=1 Tax=Amanita muscaria (strain Koide BX008) TaxID=946122 RepID=A0A0C2X1Z5_AMAMK|nr:hypothetical protein M378DRAFT_165397 [Amanita muscaria Koide BX008]
MTPSLHRSFRAQKRALRKTVGATLHALPASSIKEQSEAVTNHLLSLPFFANTRTLSCYLSVPTAELSTDPLVSAILQSDKTLFVPRIKSTNGKMDFLRLYSEEDLRSLRSGAWGIKEPTTQWMGKDRESVTDANCESLDLILLPSVAFDRNLSRLGHGKGFYDRFISSYVSSGRPRPLLVGLALREQVLEEGQVPMEETDWKMDLIVTPDGVIGDIDSI